MTNSCTTSGDLTLLKCEDRANCGRRCRLAEYEQMQQSSRNIVALEQLSLAAQESQPKCTRATLNGENGTLCHLLLHSKTFVSPIVNGRAIVGPFACGVFCSAGGLIKPRKQTERRMLCLDGTPGCYALTGWFRVLIPSPREHRPSPATPLRQFATGPPISPRTPYQTGHPPAAIQPPPCHIPPLHTTRHTPTSAQFLPTIPPRPGILPSLLK